MWQFRLCIYFHLCGEIMKKYIGYIILSCIILVLAGALVFVMLQPKDGAGNSEVAAAKPTDVPAKVYELEDILDNPLLHFFRSGHYILGYGTGPGTLAALDSYLPITKVSQAGNGLVYAVYDVQENDKEYNMYVFYERATDSEGETGYVLSSKDLVITGRVLFMNKTLSFADFSSLQAGDSVEKAEAIDPIVSIMAEDKSSTATYFHTYHLLTDGSLLLVFNRNSTDEDFTLASIEYDENFIFDGPDGKRELRIRASDYANK